MLMTDRLSKSDEAWQEPPPMDFVCVLSRGIVQALCAIFGAFLRENVSVASNTKELCTRAWRTDIKGVRGVLFFFSFKGAYNAKSIDAGSFRESRGGSQASPLQACKPLQTAVRKQNKYPSQSATFSSSRSSSRRHQGQMIAGGRLSASKKPRQHRYSW